MQLEKRLELINGHLTDLESLVIDLETSAGILKAQNGVMFSDLYDNKFTADVGHQFMLGYGTYQSFNFSTQDYILKIENDLKEINELHHKLRRTLRAIESE